MDRRAWWATQPTRSQSRAWLKQPSMQGGPGQSRSLLLLLLSCFSRVWLCATPEMAAHRAPPSLGFSRQEHWGVGCHFLLQCMKVKSESEVTQSCPTLGDPMDCSPPGSSIHGIFQARVLEWAAISFSRGSSQPRDRTWVSCIAGRGFTIWETVPRVLKESLNW